MYSALCICSSIYTLILVVRYLSIDIIPYRVYIKRYMGTLIPYKVYYAIGGYRRPYGGIWDLTYAVSGYRLYGSVYIGAYI